MDLVSGLDMTIVANLFGDAAASEFARTCAIFALASFMHAQKVTKEIKTQFGLLINVIQADLDAQKDMLGTLHGRVARIEEHLKIKE